MKKDTMKNKFLKGKLYRFNDFKASDLDQNIFIFLGNSDKHYEFYNLTRNEFISIESDICVKYRNDFEEDLTL